MESAGQIPRPVHICNPDMPGPSFCCLLSAEEVEQIFADNGLILTPAHAQDFQEAVARFAKCQAGKRFPPRSEIQRELTRVSKAFVASAEMLTDFDCSTFFGSNRRYMLVPHIDRLALKSDLSAVASYFERTKRSKAVSKAVRVLGELEAAWKGDTNDPEIRLRLDVVRLIESRERSMDRRRYVDAATALQRLADAAANARDTLANSDLSGADHSGEWARANLIRDLNALYFDAGGGFPGWTHDRASDRYHGPFLEMVDTVLRLTGETLKNGALVKAFERALKD